MAVAELRSDGEEARVHPSVTPVAGDLLDAESLAAEVRGAVHARPKVGVLPFTRGVRTGQPGREGVVDRLVIHKSANRPLGNGDQVDQSQRLSALG